MSHLRMAVMHLLTNFCANSSIQSELFTFSEIQDGDRRHLGFLVYVNRRTYASDLHLMTSRKLTSGFDFWSRGHLRVAVVHLPI